MKKTKVQIVKSLLAKKDWLEEHAWEIAFMLLVCGPMFCVTIAMAVNPRLYNENTPINSIPGIFPVVIIGALVFIIGQFILPKMLLKRIIKGYKSLSQEERSEAYWSDGWQYT